MQKPENLLKSDWLRLDPADLPILLHERFGWPGQYNNAAKNPDTLYLPLADSSCRVVLTYKDGTIISIVRGPAFDEREWERVSDEIEQSVISGSTKIGREISFSSFRVLGSWRGEHSGIQILPPPTDAPRASIEMADHPFILEFPIQESGLWSVTNNRRRREHRRLTLLLNILLAGRACYPLPQAEHCWAVFPGDDGSLEFKWVQQMYFAKFGKVVISDLSPPSSEFLAQVEPASYYSTTGPDGQGLRVPADLDEAICRYIALPSSDRARFDRAAYWVDVASRQRHFSMSATFTALVTAIESLTEGGTSHRISCPVCGKDTEHRHPGPTKLFRDFIETYAPGDSLTKQRSEMYTLRSELVHGSRLTQLDLETGFGWDPPRHRERELIDQLWGLTRIALRNWLKQYRTTTPH